MRSQRVQLRIVSGSLRGRRLTCVVGPNLRPTPQMVREALFNILGNAIPGRPFFDVFAGTGIFGLEALSRGCSFATLIERDFRLAQDIDERLRGYSLQDRSQVLRTDTYRWASYWHPPEEPVNIYLSPPFRDLERLRVDEFLKLIATLRDKMPEQSVIAIQSEADQLKDKFEDQADWDIRKYGRNVLMVWVKEATPDLAAE
ncbi:MAG: RsmD family RNA methyltransferase [Gemmataceae bacterium]